MAARASHSAAARSELGTWFRDLGIGEICYVRRAIRRGRTVYEIRAADGEYLARYDDRAAAGAALQQHDMEALSVH